MLSTGRYTAKAKPNRYPMYNNQYRYRVFDVGIPCTEYRRKRKYR